MHCGQTPKEYREMKKLGIRVCVYTLARSVILNRNACRAPIRLFTTQTSQQDAVPSRRESSPQTRLLKGNIFQPLLCIKIDSMISCCLPWIFP